MDDEPENKSHHLGDAFNNWFQYYESTDALVRLTYLGFQRTTHVPEMYRILKGAQDVIERAEKEAERAQKEIDAGYPTLHAHSLLGLWGAFECLVEDFFKATIKADPGLLSGDAFAKIKLPIDILFASDDERAETVLGELTRATSSEKSIGVTQFERILRPINLGGSVPTRVKDAVFQAQQIRHIWAHRGGVADATFVGRCPARAKTGEKVQMDTEEFFHLAGGLAMYSMIIVNRQWKNVGTEFLFTEASGYEGVFEEVGMGASTVE
ncbi:hypothetical protein RQN9TF_09490 [Rhodococcus qingshengii]|uniref:hypothetical protein n=1 Tax=Rhodococcus TaxID=1827 RepID=UPI000F61A3FC|nr:MULTISPECIES: hypothetical protein [Rhodococcus]AZI61357.1 hypothetical protein EHW12_09435 [Rhodococcus sp. NJ-530]BDQ19430.1 hypothetical protein RQN9TF_09490 [Rhodococcus qingshengii]